MPQLALAALEPIVGESESIRRLRAEIPRCAITGLSVLIRGETGTGKELVARALHQESRRSGAFVAVNCGSIPRELVESELFGHERGAFTGAQSRRQGLFVEADGGTLFLDEIGELPIDLQPRLLRVLETGRLRPVGADREVSVNVRVVAATHVNLEKAVLSGRFRGDLYYRLSVMVLETPPLRERAGDVLILAERFLKQESPRSEGRRLSQAAARALVEHSWPGNVRELRNVMLRAAALAGPQVEPSDLRIPPQTLPPTEAKTISVEGHGAVAIEGRSYLEIEREILERTLKRFGGNRRAAANALGIPKSTLCDKVLRYRIDYCGSTGAAGTSGAGTGVGAATGGEAITGGGEGVTGAGAGAGGATSAGTASTGAGAGTLAGA